MEKETFAAESSSGAKPDSIYGAFPWTLAPVPVPAPAAASAPGDRELSQYNFFQSADLGQFPGPSSRAPSRASSFGSMDSGVSHPPRSRRTGKKVVGMKYSDLTRRASDTHLSHTLIGNSKRKTAHSATDIDHSPYMIGLDGLEQWNNSMALPSIPSFELFAQDLHPEVHQSDASPPLLSHGLFRRLQSNADPHSLYGHYSDLSDPPDLYASLQEEHICPPPKDMSPMDPDLVPEQKELRFEGDLYTPRWVRGRGNTREGWCSICKPGRWLVLKNSAFWYDKTFTHGVSATTGNPFQGPTQTRRMDGNPDVWEGLCHNCDDWIALVSSKKRGTTWFRHTYKCHSHRRRTGSPNGLVPSHSVVENAPAPSSTFSSAGTVNEA